MSVTPQYSSSKFRPDNNNNTRHICGVRMKSGERDPCQLISSIITVVGTEFWRGILLSRNKVGLSPREGLITMQIIILDRSEWILNRSHSWFHFDCVHPLVCIECTWWQAAMFASPKFKKWKIGLKIIFFNYISNIHFYRFILFPIIHLNLRYIY